MINFNKISSIENEKKKKKNNQPKNFFKSLTTFWFIYLFIYYITLDNK